MTFVPPLPLWRIKSRLTSIAGSGFPLFNLPDEVAQMRLSYPPGILLMLIFLAADNHVAHAEDHGKKAQEHLQEAIESGKKGSTEGLRVHTEEARKELIEDNKEHPYTYLQKPIYGEHEKAEHDKEAFEEIDEAIREAREGHPEEATEAAERASVHLKEKEEAR
jgi:hypothetical protein